MDRKASMLTTELHDVRVQSEITEKARRAAEAEVRQASELISQLTATNSTLSISQKKLATEHQQLVVHNHVYQLGYTFSPVVLVLVVVVFYFDSQSQYYWTASVGRRCDA